MSDLHNVVTHILDARHSVPAARAVLAAITGIDGCGKGYVTARIVNRLQAEGLRAAAVNIDGWLNLPNRRFDPSNPGEHFYLHAIRFDEMFAQLVLPLRDRRSLRCEADYAEEMATKYRRHVYFFEDIDVIVLEGIYLLKRAYQPYYDLSCWIECSFDTALERAIFRAQEGLPPEETVRAYRTIYFPAQEVHFQRDAPKAAATLIVNNDARLGPVSWDQ
jgi:uridine kinase